MPANTEARPSSSCYAASTEVRSPSSYEAPAEVRPPSSCYEVSTEALVEWIESLLRVEHLQAIEVALLDRSRAQRALHREREQHDARSILFRGVRDSIATLDRELRIHTIRSARAEGRYLRPFGIPHQSLHKYRQAQSWDWI